MSDSEVEVIYVTVTTTIAFNYPEEVKGLELHDHRRTGQRHGKLTIEMMGKSEEAVRNALNELRTNLANALLGK